MSVQNSLFKKFTALGVSMVMLLLSVPAAMAGGSYHGANGNYYHNDDFWNDDFTVTASQLDGWAGFCWQAPNTYYEGYAVYATEGSFTGGLSNYDPKMLGKNSLCYTYPKQFKNDTTVTVHVYPYIELEGGARKYIQPGNETSIYVKGYKEQNNNTWFDALNLSKTSTEVMASISWDELPGLGTDFTKYNVKFKKGYYTTLPSDAANSYVSWNYYNLSGLGSGETWSFQVVPVKLVNGKYVEVGNKSAVVQVTTKMKQDPDPVYENSLSLSIDQWQGGLPHFNWSSYNGSFNGYALLVAKGKVSSSQWKNSSYSVQSYLTKNETSYQVASIMSSPNDQYTARVVPYKYSSNGQMQYIESAYSNPITFQTSLSIDPMSIWISSWQDGLPELSWSAFTDMTFDGYAVFVGEGKLTATQTMENKAFYLGKNLTSYQMAKMKSNTLYTVVMVPYINRSNSIEYVVDAYSGALVFKTGSNDVVNGNTYVGKDGTVYTEADFLKSSTVLSATTVLSNKAYFTWTKPGKNYDGYALYVTEGDFEGGLSNYEPIYLNKNKSGYMYPKSFKANTKVSAYIYPYIELKNGARKFIQPSSAASIIVKAKKTPSVKISTPIVISPKFNSVLTNFPRKATLMWTKVRNASSYEVEIACDTCTSSTVKWLDPSTYTTSKTSFMTPALAGDNEFRFRVRAVSESGVKGSWSSYRYFSYDTSGFNN